jgi:hypothetical protein
LNASLIECNIGLNASPFLLNATLKHHVSNYLETDPEFVKVLESLYVNNLVSGYTDILPKDTLPKDILPNGHFADGRFAEQTFCRTDILDDSFVRNVF